MSAPAHEGESDFAAALLDVKETVPHALERRAGHAPERRFAVYRNNVYASLIDMLASRFPVSAKLVGEEFFRAMGRLYVEKSPPSSPVLLHFGKSLPDFIAAFPPARTVPYLADVARLEWARHEAYHAADASPLAHDALASLGGEAERVRLTLHPSARLLRSAYPVMTIWRHGSQEGRKEQIRLPEGGEDVLVLRPALDVEMRSLPGGGFAFIQALSAGASLMDAASKASQEAAAFDLADSLAGLITAGAIAGAGVNNHAVD